MYDDKTYELDYLQFYFDLHNAKVSFTLPEYHRSTQLDMKVMGVNSATLNFNSPFSGFLGIAPYTALNPDQRDRSVLWQLKSNGYIDHSTVALYASHREDDLSLIKFGSYDKLGMKDNGYGLRVFKTIDTKSWKLKATYGSMTGREIFSGDRTFLVDPQIPYIYLPAFDYLMFAIRMATFDRSINCGDSYNHFCSYPKPCDQVPDLGIDFRITIADDEQSQTFIIPQKSFMIPGKLLGDDRSDTCHFAIRKNINQSDTNTVYVGNMFLRDHYVFLDMSPYENENADYLNVGIADRNPGDVIGEAHYNPNNKNYYSPEKASNDISKNTNGNDPYKSQSYDNAAISRGDENVVEYTEKWVEGHKVEAVVIFTFIVVAIVVGIAVYCYCRINRKYKY